MRLYDFIHKLDKLNIYRNCDDPSTIDCVCYVPRRKTIVGYPIVSMSVVSTHDTTKVILNAVYETYEGRNCIKLDQLYNDLKDLYRYLDKVERRCTVFMSVQQSKTSPITYRTIPIWGDFILDPDRDAMFIKATNSASYLKNI